MARVRVCRAAPHNGGTKCCGASCLQVEHWSKALGWQKLKGAGKDMVAYQKPAVLDVQGFAVCPDGEGCTEHISNMHLSAA